MLNEVVKCIRNRTVRLEREGDYWEDEEKDQLVRMFHDGVGITEMAMALQRTEPAIIQQVEKLDLYQRKASPIRRKNQTKAPQCLCTACSLDPALCPMNRRDTAIQEGV